MNRRSILRFLGLAPLAAIMLAVVPKVAPIDTTPVRIVKAGEPIPFCLTTLDPKKHPGIVRFEDESGSFLGYGYPPEHKYYVLIDTDRDFRNLA